MENREIVTNIQFTTFKYTNPREAVAAFESLSLIKRQQMAKVYQGAFAGPPWFEVCKCPNCGKYSPDATCKTDKCGTINLPEAYPTDWLINTYFKEMLSAFSPGTLILAEDLQEGVIGFATGGFTTLKDLIDKKYKGNLKILESIKNNVGSNLQNTETVFYENEACVIPTIQQKGFGSLMNNKRIDIALDMGANAICARSVNLPWLAKKRTQFEDPKREMRTWIFIPDGDDYIVSSTGASRYFAFAAKKS